ncbi:MAG: tyrosine--tRNA ligase [Chlorobi bacterium]|nr:tyrosine--tRNA ligase [Chlorobiota bacterium]
MKADHSQVVAELSERQLINDKTNQVEDHLKSPRKVYLGFDPTAPSLHVGSLAPLIMLIHFARHGHTPVIVMGNGTALIGDPSGKDKERPLLPREQIQENAKHLNEQIRHLLRIAPSNIEFYNNSEWLEKLSLIEFLRDTGKHITVNYMLAKESVKKRLEKGISYTEFTYMLLQGYDFWFLFKNHDVTVQVGGADQWGNITTGIELIRRREGKEAHGITCPLLLRADGTKFGKTEQGNIWLDPTKTSPFRFYQYWINVSDSEVPMLLKRLTLLPLEEINRILQEHESAPEKRIAQKTLAKELTIWVHGQEEYEKVKLASEILFGKENLKRLQELPEQTLQQIIQEIPSFKVQIPDDGIPLLDLLTGRLSQSRSELKRLIKSGSIKINKKTITDPKALITKENLLSHNIILIQKGKKDYYVLVNES